MDRYHGTRFWVYEDADSAGNHFLVWPGFTKAGESTGCPIVIHGDTRDGIPGGAASCAGGADEASAVRWHRYSPPAEGEATFSLCGSSFDTVLSVYRDGKGLVDDVEIACNDNACGQQSELTVSVHADASYLVRIAGMGSAMGPYVLTINGPAAPDAQANLNCDVSVEFDAFTARIHDDGGDSPIASGATAIQFRFNYSSVTDFGGLVMNNGVWGKDGELGPNYGLGPSAGVDLTGATALKFLARGEKGGEKIEFFVGGVGWDACKPIVSYPESAPAIKCRFPLTTDWREYTIPLEGVDLSRVIGGFGWAANPDGDPDLGSGESDDAIIFYVDNVYFELDAETANERLQQSPRFLQSYTPRTLQGVADPIVRDFDHRFRNVAYVYDNALALLAFLAEGTADGLSRARLIADAFVYASTHDRTLYRGELRSAYPAGDLVLPPDWAPNGIVNEVRLPGFFNPQRQEFQSLFIDNISVGNTAWAMISLLAVYERTGESTYLDAARRLGEFIQAFRDDAVVDETGENVGGFAGGLDQIEGEPERVPFSSAEHNIDVYAAFKLMYDLTGEAEWLDGAEHARRYVWSLWDDQLGCFCAGTDSNGVINTNASQLPLDVQAWAVLGIPETQEGFPDVLQCAMAHHRVEGCAPDGDGFDGFDFNSDRDGVWFEGTAHMATAFALAGPVDLAVRFREELCRAQNESLDAELRQELPRPFDDVIGLPAGSRDGISTGFDYTIVKRLHVAAAAWNVFAQLGFNPYLPNGVASDAAQTPTTGRTCRHATR